MSKSAESPADLIKLLDDPKVIAKRIKSAVTDAETEIEQHAVGDALQTGFALGSAQLGVIQIESDDTLFGIVAAA